MRMTISEFLEHVDSALPRCRYRIQAVQQEAPPSTDRRRARISPGYVVIVQDASSGKPYEFIVSREDLATDARGEWQASVIARAVRELSVVPQRAAEAKL